MTFATILLTNTGMSQTLRSNIIEVKIITMKHRAILCANARRFPHPQPNMRSLQRRQSQTTITRGRPYTVLWKQLQTPKVKQTALRQIMEQLNALSVADQSQVTALLAAKVQPESDQRQVQLDAEIEREKQAQDAKIIVTDPYNEERAGTSGYEREKPRGFVCFK